ncbi:hypothetical protein PAMP_005249 [Pampus punctatissimus]
MACIPFQTQLSSIMEVLVKAAVAEISKLVDDKCAFLHLEISRKQNENEMLKRKLLMMENKHAQLQRGFENHMDRGTDVGNCPHPTENIKFPEIDDAAVSFTIKEESPDEALWISDSVELIGSAVQYPNPANAAESQQFEEDHQFPHSEVVRQKTSEFNDSYESGQHAGEISGLHLTVKTEKEEDRSGFSQDGCQHGAGKQNPADFSLDERENQLWSSIIEGNDIDSGFPDFSSVVEEYSNTFPDHSDTHVVSNTGKSANVQQSSSQRPCNGIYNSKQTANKALTTLYGYKHWCLNVTENVSFFILLKEEEEDEEKWKLTYFGLKTGRAENPCESEGKVNEQEK